MPYAWILAAGDRVARSPFLCNRRQVISPSALKSTSPASLFSTVTRTGLVSTAEPDHVGQAHPGMVVGLEAVQVPGGLLEAAAEFFNGESGTDGSINAVQLTKMLLAQQRAGRAGHQAFMVAATGVKCGEVEENVLAVLRVRVCPRC